MFLSLPSELLLSILAFLSVRKVKLYRSWKSPKNSSSSDVYLRNLFRSLPSIQTIELSHIYLKGYFPENTRILCPFYPVGNALTSILYTIGKSNKIQKLKITGILDAYNVKIDRDITSITSLHINALNKSQPQYLTFFYNLEHLSLRSAHWRKGRLRLPKFHWSRLKRVSLHRFSVSKHDLLSFVARHSSLEQLTLENMYFSEGSWISFCLRLRALGNNISVKLLGTFNSRENQWPGPPIRGKELERLILENPFY
ncbi:uncharacterized protein PgNI_11662 [Pyricularia grisea]|uniref:F-box domain-containing protein n=1 Tax=Pyricularia grisea TaxID=148305 RepID=A0A6P8ANG6_PYRGI|nr:uncharacterized protein PgNI_11662 [Pyricularia grisea]TLD03582.1 hypothetical protein PgNI_11662 [Pyricularia grisea]